MHKLKSLASYQRIGVVLSLIWTITITTLALQGLFDRDSQWHAVSTTVAESTAAPSSVSSKPKPVLASASGDFNSFSTVIENPIPLFLTEPQIRSWF